MEPIRVTVRRGGIVEAEHLVHAVAVRDGEVVAAAGDRDRVVFLRSTAKPFQALPLVRERPDLDEAEIAIAAASHQAEPAQLEAVRTLLARAGVGEDALECGEQEGRPPGRIHNNCSGKHAGMLVLCRARGWPAEGYRLAGHPLQRLLLAEVAGAAELAPDEVGTAVDGCGVLTFALPLRRAALAWSRLERLDGGAAVAAAMRVRPELVGGAGADDTELMRALPGVAGKRGAEGVFGIAGPGGLGVALKVEVGAARALRPALAAFLGELGLALPGLGTLELVNSRGERVGEVAAV